MRLEISDDPTNGRRVLLSLEPSEAESVIGQLTEGLAHQQIDKTHSHSIILHGTKESSRDIAHIIINSPLKH